MKFLSFVIPAHNEERCIGMCLDVLVGQLTPQCEVIVVNDGSTDSTKDVVKGYPVKLINFRSRHSAAFARNRGAQLAQGEYLIFLDADHVIERRFVRKVGQFLKREVPDASDYLVYSYEPRGLFQRAWSAYRKLHPSFRFPHIIRRDVFHKLGGFDEKIFYFEDYELRERLSKTRHRYAGPIPARVYHIDPAGWSEYVRQRKWHARGIFCMLKWRRKWGMLRHFAPLILIPLSYFSPFPLIAYLLGYWLFYWSKSRESFNSMLWVLLDLVGRAISLCYLLRWVLGRHAT